MEAYQPGTKKSFWLRLGWALFFIVVFLLVSCLTSILLSLLFNVPIHYVTRSVLVFLVSAICFGGRDGNKALFRKQLLVNILIAIITSTGIFFLDRYVL